MLPDGSHPIPSLQTQSAAAPSFPQRSGTDGPETIKSKDLLWCGHGGSCGTHLRPERIARMLCANVDVMAPALALGLSFSCCAYEVSRVGTGQGHVGKQVGHGRSWDGRVAVQDLHQV